jgi:hypothetical protein
MSSFEVVSIERIHQIVAPIVESLLDPAGFQVQKPLQWLRSEDAPIRQIFSLKQWKGGALAPAWGLSLDFVPHISGGSVNWHRTVKSARMDLTYDPREPALDMSYIRGADQVAQKSTDVLRAAVSQAHRFWSSARSISELPQAFECVKRHLSTSGLGFYNYTQHPVAYAFVLARTGNANAAREELDRFLSSCRSEVTRERLRELLAAADAA